MLRQDEASKADDGRHFFALDVHQLVQVALQNRVDGVGFRRSAIQASA